MNTSSDSPRPTASRKLSIFAYFEQLQFEWICNDLRERIYQQEVDKKHWGIVKEGKRVKIEDIARKNKLPTIFDDEELRETFNKKIYRDTGFPNFLYKDQRQRSVQEFYDMAAYFHTGIDIRVDIAGETVVCKIVSYKPYELTMRVKQLSTDKTFEVPVKDCGRIM